MRHRRRLCHGRPQARPAALPDAEWPEEIDERLAREEEAREKEKLRQAQSQREFLITKANLAHAMARLRAVSRHSINNQ